MIENNNILITGGCGFIGSNLTNYLAQYNNKITVIDNLQSGKIENIIKSNSIKIKNIDIQNKEKLEEYVKNQDYIFHLAANANVPYSVKNPIYDFETNIIGTFNIINLAMKYNSIKRIVYASSAAVYGNPKYIPIDEEHPLEPVSPYGASKLAGEKLGISYYYTYGLPFVSIRIFNVYGKGQNRYVMYDLLNKLYNNRNVLEVLGTGEQVRDYLNIKDAIKGLILAAETKNIEGNTYNLASGKPTTIKDLVRMILENLDLYGKTKIIYTGKSWKGDIKKLVGNIEKIKHDLNFKPEISLENGLSEFISWFFSMKDKNKNKNK
ncbi:MAG: GDP-mannose 4,6-dehydratase [Candidatus Helarchaeota archaeon]